MFGRRALILIADGIDQARLNNLDDAVGDFGKDADLEVGSISARSTHLGDVLLKGFLWFEDGVIDESSIRVGVLFQVIADLRSYSCALNLSVARLVAV